MKITPIRPVGTTKVARVKKTDRNLAGKASGAYKASSPHATKDAVAIMGIPEAELTPKVRDALMSLMAEVAEMRKELAATRQELASIASLADRDSLLPIQNRRAFVRELTRTMSHVERYGKASSVVYIDVNDLKEINDNFGHGAGDDALKHVANILLNNVRESDRVGRLGGDEFCVILDEADTKSAREKAEGLAKSITDKPFSYEGNLVTVKVAVGVYTFNGTEDVSQALAAADKDMYANKQQIKENEGK